MTVLRCRGRVYEVEQGPWSGITVAQRERKAVSLRRRQRKNMLKRKDGK